MFTLDIHDEQDYEDFKEIVDHEETKLVELPGDPVPDPVPQVVNKSQVDDDSSAVSTIIGNYSVLRICCSSPMKGELRWRGPNSISKFDHHNLNGGAVDDT
jgi:hypothetical protein